MMLLVDTNGLLRTVQPASHHHSIAISSLERVESQGVELCVVPQVIYEFWGAATRPVEANGLGMDAVQAERSIEAFAEEFRLLRDERGIYTRWRELVLTHAVQGKPAHDARLVAAMLRHGVTHLLTFNTVDFKRFTDIVAISPEDVVAGRVTLP